MFSVALLKILNKKLYVKYCVFYHLLCRFLSAPRRFHADSGAISRDNLLKIVREVKQGSMFMSDSKLYVIFNGVLISTSNVRLKCIR